MKALVYASLLTIALMPAGAALAGQGKKAGTTALSAQEAAHLTFMREEEKVARDLYINLNNRWGSMVFSNISQSEETHFTVLGNALVTYKLPDPALPGLGAFSNPDLQALYNTLLGQGEAALVAALKVGGLVEEVDIKDLDTAIAATTHADLTQIYGNLKCGSRNHLRAFARNLANQGVTYVAQALTQAQVDAILNSANERCGMQ